MRQKPGVQRNFDKVRRIIIFFLLALPLAVDDLVGDFVAATILTFTSRSILFFIKLFSTQEKEMLALLLEKQVQDVEVRVHIVRNIDIGLDLSLVLQLDDVVVLINLWLSVVLFLDRLVVFLRYAVLQHYLLVKVFEEFVDKLALLLLLLFIKGFLLF